MDDIGCKKVFHKCEMCNRKLIEVVRRDEMRITNKGRNKCFCQPALNKVPNNEACTDIRMLISRMA